MSDTSKPAPHPSPLTQPYWDGAAQGVLRVQQCAACGRLRHYPRYLCDECHSFDVTWKDCSGRGTVHSWMVAHHAFHPGFKEDLPYTLVVVEMEEGVRALGRFTGEAPRIGMPVVIHFTAGAEGFALPAFAPAAALPEA
ncbi:MAG: OB-fold domain-containing protein [Roseomonas sp.]|nr:OB-fold domain-containing protein [Roseomonas sp.]